MRSLVITFNIIVFVSLSYSSYGQSSSESMKPNYEKNAIYLRSGFLGTQYVKNDKRNTFSLLWNNNLYNEISKSKEAKYYYKKSRKNSQVAMGLSILSSVFTIYTLSLINQPLSGTVRRRNNQLVAGLSLGVVSSLIAVPILIKSSNQLQRSVHEYNKDLYNSF